MQQSAHRLAQIVGYDLPVEQPAEWTKEEKQPQQVFLGLEPGAVVSLADRKVFQPTHPSLVEHYTRELADHLR